MLYGAEDETRTHDELSFPVYKTGPIATMGLRQNNAWQNRTVIFWLKTSGSTINLMHRILYYIQLVEPVRLELTTLALKERCSKPTELRFRPKPSN